MLLRSKCSYALMYLLNFMLSFCISALYMLDFLFQTQEMFHFRTLDLPSLSQFFQQFCHLQSKRIDENCYHCVRQCINQIPLKTYLHCLIITFKSCRKEDIQEKSPLFKSFNKNSGTYIRIFHFQEVVWGHESLVLFDKSNPVNNVMKGLCSVTFSISYNRS